MKLNKDNTVKKMLFIFAVITLFFAAIIQVSSDEEKVRYSDLEKEEIGEDEESQNALRVYYGEILGRVKRNSKFNTIAIHRDIAILNVTINGKDRRILTRLRTATLYPGLINYTFGDLITTTNLVVLGNISLKGILFTEVDVNYGPRRLFGLESTSLRHVDEGSARLIDGEARISVNPILKELISSYNVFLSPQGLTRGLYVAEKSNSYFVVKGVNANSNVAFTWMLRGIRNDFDVGHLVSRYGLEKGITITATIDYENDITTIKIDGFDKLLDLIAAASNNTLTTSGTNSVGNQTINLITGNLIDEFGLETDLGKILSDSISLDLEGTTDSNIDLINDTNNDLVTSQTNDSSGGLNQTTQISTLEFTVLSVDEDFIVGQIASVTELSSFDVRKLVNFVYKEPLGFEDEVIDLQAKLDFIEKINGSVIISLG